MDEDCVKGPCPEVIGCDQLICKGGGPCFEDEDGNGKCVDLEPIFGCRNILCKPDQICVEDTGDGTAGCVDPPNCGGIEGCAKYNNGCDNCVCAGGGSQECTRIFDCDFNDPEVFCPGCDPIPPPYTCDECAPGYFRDAKGQCSKTQSCGGIEFCTGLSFKNKFICFDSVYIDQLKYK